MQEKDIKAIRFWMEGYQSCPNCENELGDSITEHLCPHCEEPIIIPDFLNIKFIDQMEKKLKELDGELNEGS